MFKYYVYESNPMICLEYSSYYVAIHEALMLLITKSSCSVSLDVVLTTNEKVKFPIKVNTLKIDDSFMVLSQDGKKYTLTNSNELYNFTQLYDDQNNNINKYIINSIFNLLGQKQANTLELKHSQNNQNNVTNVLKQKKGEKEETKDLVNNILTKINKNTEPLIECVPKKIEEEKNDIPEVEVEKLRTTIEKLEKAKEMTEDAIEDFVKELERDEENLSSYITNYNEEQKETKKRDEELEKNISVYISEKEYTYKKIYNSMIKSGGINFEKIPSLFISKFPVFLFMDGKDCEGNDVRDRLLDTDDEYRIFKILYDSLVDENFNEPENDDDAEIICEFMDFLPNGYQAITPQEIMNFHNKKDNSGACIMFKEDETEQEECFSNEQNDTYTERAF